MLHTPFADRLIAGGQGISWEDLEEVLSLSHSPSTYAYNTVLEKHNGQDSHRNIGQSPKPFAPNMIGLLGHVECKIATNHSRKAKKRGCDKNQQRFGVDVVELINQITKLLFFK